MAELGAGLQVLQRTATTTRKIFAGRHSALHRGAQHFEQHALIEIPPAPLAPEADLLASQRTRHQHAFATGHSDNTGAF